MSQTFVGLVLFSALFSRADEAKKILSDAERVSIEARLSEMSRKDELDRIRHQMTENSAELVKAMYAANKVGVVEYLGTSYQNAEFVVERTCLLITVPSVIRSVVTYRLGRGVMRAISGSLLALGGLVAVSCGAVGAIHSWAAFYPSTNRYLIMSPEDLETELQKRVKTDQRLRQRLAFLSSR